MDVEIKKIIDNTVKNGLYRGIFKDLSSELGCTSTTARARFYRGNLEALDSIAELITAHKKKTRDAFTNLNEASGMNPYDLRSN